MIVSWGLLLLLLLEYIFNELLLSEVVVLKLLLFVVVLFYRFLDTRRKHSLDSWINGKLFLTWYCLQGGLYWENIIIISILIICLLYDVIVVFFCILDLCLREIVLSGWVIILEKGIISQLVLLIHKNLKLIRMYLISWGMHILFIFILFKLLTLRLSFVVLIRIILNVVVIITIVRKSLKKSKLLRLHLNSNFKN